MSDPKTIDLEPHEYRQVIGPKRHEPILSPGWIWGIVGLLAVFAVKAAIFIAVRGLY